MSSDTFPRQHARTRRFTLGQPRDVSVSADGARIIFLRSSGGSDPVNSLWVADAHTGAERQVADPRTLLDDTSHDAVSDEERAMRERARETADGITGYATDAAGTVAAFSLSGRLFAAGLISGAARPIDVPGPVFDPRPDPTARRIAYVRGAELRIAELDGSSRTIAGPDADESEVSWGSADFVAAEEMGRYRGYWWSPDGEMIAATRVDDSPVDTWVIADPANPATPAREVRYPAAGTSNPTVSLHLLRVDASAAPIEVVWDVERFGYLASVSWGASGLLLLVQSRDQRATQTLTVDVTTGTTSVRATDTDDRWVELVPGSPQLTAGGRLVNTVDRDGARRLMVGGEVVTPTDLQVRSIVAANDDHVLFTANPIDDATVVHVWRHRSVDDGTAELTAITTEAGIHTAASGGGTLVIRTSTLDAAPVMRTSTGIELASMPESPLVTPNVVLSTETERGLATALLLPHDHDGSPLPVLLDPYGGPHALRVLQSQQAFLASQWFADQGFAVVVTDGRGTPGRGSDWERDVFGDLATAPLDDQVDALLSLADRHDELDLGRVAIRGWSFGGYLAALAVLRRPDVFHCAIAGAPVTEWRLYDTHYTERYLGRPESDHDDYDASSLLPLAAELTRPLLLIHGLADDNVVAAHTLRLSQALLAAGRPHEVLPLAGVTHMTPQEVVAENLLLHQLDFLRRSLPTD